MLASSQGVCGDAGFGRGMPLPYMASGHDRPNGLAAAARANVGRDALIPPHPAVAQGSAGGIIPAPTGKFCVSGKPGGRNVCPGLQGRATALPQGYAARQAGPIWNRPLHGVFAAAGMFPILNRQGAAGVNARPTEPGKHGGHPGNTIPAAVANPCRGRCSHRPGVFAAAWGSGGACPSPTWHPGTTGQMGLPHPPGRT